MTSKFVILWDFEGERKHMIVPANTRESVETFVNKEMSDAENVSIRDHVGWLDERIRSHIQKLKLAERVTRDPEYKGQVSERLRACADAAYMFGEDAQTSLERTLDRAVVCEWEITGLDGHMFSFGFQSPKGGFWGGIIFHCRAKEWSTHT